MGMQSFSGAPGRNQSKAATIPGEISVGNIQKTKVTADKVAKAQPAKGASVAGFSGIGVKPGFVK